VARDPDNPDHIDPALIRFLVPVVDAFCKAWYRLDVEGMALVPRGAALIVTNHDSGITFLELLGMGARWYAERGTGEVLSGLGHDRMFDIPVVGDLLVRMGGVRATHANADALFARGRKVVVAPGGNLEAFRPWTERDRIKFGGRKGFIRLAMRHRVPIVPVVFHGGHGGFLVLSDGEWIVRLLGLRRLLRVDTWPIMIAAPWGLAVGPVFHLPLPVKVRARFLAPIPTDGLPPGADAEPVAVDALYETVTFRMQAALTEMSKPTPPDSAR
jgi:1-acyl-sn-glycerol-3-phosphate acyltransferase